MKPLNDMSDRELSDLMASATRGQLEHNISRMKKVHTKNTKDADKFYIPYEIASKAYLLALESSHKVTCNGLLEAATRCVLYDKPHVNKNDKVTVENVLYAKHLRDGNITKIIKRWSEHSTIAELKKCGLYKLTALTKCRTISELLNKVITMMSLHHRLNTIENDISILEDENKHLYELFESNTNHINELQESYEMVCLDLFSVEANVETLEARLEKMEEQLQTPIVNDYVVDSESLRLVRGMLSTAYGNTRNSSKLCVQCLYKHNISKPLAKMIMCDLKQNVFNKHWRDAKLDMAG